MEKQSFGLKRGHPPIKNYQQVRTGYSIKYHWLDMSTSQPKWNCHHRYEWDSRLAKQCIFIIVIELNFAWDFQKYITLGNWYVTFCLFVYLFIIHFTILYKYWSSNSAVYLNCEGVARFPIVSIQFFQ